MKNFDNFILSPGIIKSFFLNIWSIAYRATNLLDNGFTANSTPATLLKFVWTGPGHKTDTFTFVVNFPTLYNDAAYQDLIETIEITIDVKQV